MLHQIACEIFSQKQIVFHKGLNAVVGDDIASNSIGKSTMLMIVDFVFGGEEYIRKNHDVIDQLGHHTFLFSFIFDEEEFFFSRSTNEYKYVSVCNEKYESSKSIKIVEYTAFLQKKYRCELEGLSFREIVGRYFRVYGKENLNEHKPIQYFEKETAKQSITALLKLFDKYLSIKNYEEQIQKLSEERTLLTDATKKDLIPKINKSIFTQNQKKIDELSVQIDNLKTDIVSASANLEALVSKEILDLQKEKSARITYKNMIESRLQRTRTNLRKQNIEIGGELSQLVEYFPDFNVELVNQLTAFHEGITVILTDELKSTEKELQRQLVETDAQIQSIDKEIASKLEIRNAPKFAVDRVVELVAQIAQLKGDNGFYTKKKHLDESIKSASDNLAELKEKILDEICSQINTKMYELNKTIYVDGRRAPTLTIHGDRYTFNTYGDTGTGTAFANLISFDLSLLELTCLPAIAHDLPLLKNIENPALESIITLYSQSVKQIFIAIDKLSSYSKTTYGLVESNKVLQLSKEKLLFTKNWKQEMSE